MSRYLLSIYQPDGDPPPPDVLDRVMADVETWNREAKAAGVWVFTAALRPPGAAVVVRPGNSATLVTDGPFVEGKEHIGGFTIISALDLDAALDWGRKLARAATLPIEVRPLQDDAEA